MKSLATLLLLAAVCVAALVLCTGAASPTATVAVQPSAAAANCPCGCACGADCSCAASVWCGDPQCSCGQPVAALPVELPLPPEAKTAPAGATEWSLNDAVDAAVARQIPLLIWVRQKASDPTLADVALQVHVSEYEGNTDVVRQPALIIGVPSGNGLNRVATLLGTPSRQEILSVLQPPAPPIAVQPRFFMPPPMMPMFGCVGGG